MTKSYLGFGGNLTLIFVFLLYPSLIPVILIAILVITSHTLVLVLLVSTSIKLIQLGMQIPFYLIFVEKCKRNTT